VQELGGGVAAGTADDAAAADIVVLAVMWPDVPRAVDGLDWSGRVVIDPTNDFGPSDLNGRTSSEVVAELVTPGSRREGRQHVRRPPCSPFDPQQAGGQRVIFLSGDDDPKAKAVVGELFEDAGFFVIDLGGLREGGQMQQVGGPLAGLDLIRLP